MTTEELTEAFNDAGLDTKEKVAAFLKPSAIAAQLADYDGRIAAISRKRGDINSEMQTEIEALTAEREEVRKKLQGDER